MNAEHPTTERLQRSFDGELSRGEAEAVRAHVASCAQCTRELDSLSRLGELMRIGAQTDSSQRSDDDFSRMFANIEQAIDTPNVRALRAEPRAAKPSRLRGLYRAAPALGAVALAAAALLMVYRPDQQGEIEDAPYEAVIGGHSEVVEVDFGPNAGTVFDISLSDGSSIPVVWIDDDDEE